MSHNGGAGHLLALGISGPSNIRLLEKSSKAIFLKKFLCFLPKAKLKTVQAELKTNWGETLRLGLWHKVRGPVQLDACAGCFRLRQGRWPGD